ncbi:MAG: signal peptidase I [Tenericutes bacterium]|nr:signal peptidase I [Mycoplasmatota bacterium]
MRKWILNLIEITILIIISFFAFLLIFQSTFLKNKSIFGYRSYVIASNSMYPVLEYGDVILVKDISFDDIEIGDIITYQGNNGELKNKIITHEVIDINYVNDVRVLVTKGRANTGVDPYVYPEQIYGKFFYKYTIISFVSKIVRNKFGFVLFIFIPFGILFVLEFINMVKETKRRELEKLVKAQLEELRKINDDSKKADLIDNTICIQLEEIEKAKRDFKKIDELEHTIKLSLDDVNKEIEKLKNQDSDNNEIVEKEYNDMILEETRVINLDDIKKGISKELRIKRKKKQKEKKQNNNS